MIPGYHLNSPMKMPSNFSPSDAWEPSPVDTSGNLTDGDQSSPIKSRRRSEQQQQQQRNSSSQEVMTSLGDHLGRRLVTASRSSAAKSLSGIEYKRRSSDYDTPSRSSPRRDYDDSKSLVDFSEMKRRGEKKEKKKSSSKKTSKKEKTEPRLEHSRSMGDLPELPTDFRAFKCLSGGGGGDTLNADFSRRKLSTIPSQRLLLGGGSSGDARSVVSAPVLADTPQERARRQLMMQQRMAMRRQSETLDKDKMEQPSLEAFLNKSRSDDADAAAGSGDDDDNSDDNETFFSMFQWSVSENEKKERKKKLLSSSRSVGGGSHSVTGSSRRSLSRSKSVSGRLSASPSRDRSRKGEVKPSLAASKNSSKPKPQTAVARSKSDAGILNSSSRNELSEKHKAMLLGELYNGSGSFNFDDFSPMDDLSKEIMSSVKQSSREERRASRRESRASLVNAYAAAADAAGINSTDDIATNLLSPTSRSPRDNRSSHSRRKLADDTDNDTQSRSTHSGRKDETKEERKIRKKAEKAAEKEEKDERRSSCKTKEHGSGEDLQSSMSSFKDLSRRRSSSKHNKADSEEASKMKKKKKESRRKSEDDGEGINRRRSKSVATVRRDGEKVSHRRSKSISAPREDTEPRSRRRSKAIGAPPDQDDKGVVVRRSKSVSGSRDKADNEPRRRSKSISASQNDDGLTKRRSKSIGTTGSKKSRSSSKRRKSSKLKAETEVAETDSTKEEKITVVSPEYPMKMHRTAAFDEDSGDGKLAAPKIEPVQTYCHYHTSDDGDATVIVLSDTDNEDEKSQVSQVEHTEMHRFYASCSSDDMLDDFLLQFDPSESDNIERIELQDLDVSQTEGIMTMPQTSFSRASSDAVITPGTQMSRTKNRSLTRGGSTLSPYTLGRHKSMRRLIKRTAGNLFRREKAAGDDNDVSQSPLPRGCHDQADT